MAKRHSNRKDSNVPNLTLAGAKAYTRLITEEKLLQALNQDQPIDIDLAVEFAQQLQEDILALVPRGDLLAEVLKRLDSPLTRRDWRTLSRALFPERTTWKQLVKKLNSRHEGRTLRTLYSFWISLGVPVYEFIFADWGCNKDERVFAATQRAIRADEGTLDKYDRSSANAEMATSP
jgi:hypothetical protein